MSLICGDVCVAAFVVAPEISRGGCEGRRTESPWAETYTVLVVSVQRRHIWLSETMTMRFGGDWSGLSCPGLGQGEEALVFHVHV